MAIALKEEREERRKEREKMGEKREKEGGCSLMLQEVFTFIVRLVCNPLHCLVCVVAISYDTVGDLSLA